MDFKRIKKIMRFVDILPKRNFRCPKILQQGSYLLMKKISNVKQWNSPTLQTPTALLGLLTYFKKGDPAKDEFNSIMKKSTNLIEDKDYDMAEKYLEEALALAKQMESVECIANVYDVMGNAALRQSNFVKARQYYNREIKTLKSEPYEEGSVKILRARVKIAYVRQRQGKYHVSKSEYKELAGKIQLQLNSADKNNVELLELLAFAKNQLGNVLLRIRQYDEAKKCFADAYDAYSRAYESDNIEIVDVLCNMSYACQLCEDKSAAIKFLEAALSTAERLQDEMEVARIKTELGLLYLKGSIMTSAKKNCEDALKVGIKHNNKFVIEKANKCLAKIKEADKKK